MGILLNSYILKHYLESAPEETQTADRSDATINSQDQTTDYTSMAPDAGDDNSNDQATDNQETENTNPEEGGDDQNQPTDYTSMVPDAQDDGSDTNTGMSQPQSNAGQEGEDSEVDDLKSQEEELYRNLSPEQLDIKHKELKTQFLNMYDTIVSIIDRIGDASVGEDNIGIIEYISGVLIKLKEMVTDYTNSVYQTKSYMENSINYNRFLAVLNGINKILEEMNSKNA